MRLPGPGPEAIVGRIVGVTGHVLEKGWSNKGSAFRSTAVCLNNDNESGPAIVPHVKSGIGIQFCTTVLVVITNYKCDIWICLVVNTYYNTFSRIILFVLSTVGSTYETGTFASESRWRSSRSGWAFSPGLN